VLLLFHRSEGSFQRSSGTALAVLPRRRKINYRHSYRHGMKLIATLIRRLNVQIDEKLSGAKNNSIR